MWVRDTQKCYAGEWVSYFHSCQITLIRRACSPLWSNDKVFSLYRYFWIFGKFYLHLLGRWLSTTVCTVTYIRASCSRFPRWSCNPLLTKLVRNVSKQIFVNVDFKCMEFYIVSLFVQAGCSVCWCSSTNEDEYEAKTSPGWLISERSNENG